MKLVSRIYQLLKLSTSLLFQLFKPRTLFNNVPKYLQIEILNQLIMAIF